MTARGMGAIPAELSAALLRSGLTAPELLSVNERKGRFCLRAERDGRSWFVKWNSPKSREHSLLLQKEKKIYEALAGSGIVPELLRADDELLALRFLDGSRTLRSRLLGGDRAEEAARAAVDAYATFLDAMRRNGGALEELCKAVSGTAQFDRHLWQLFQSGPQDTKVDRFRRKVNQLPLARARRRNRIGAHLQSAAPRRALIHGDLHLNNFLLGGAVTLLDFEDAAAGYVEIELAYFLAQTEALMDDRRVFDGLRDAALSRIEGLHIGLFEEVFAWYRAAIACNPRFLKSESGRPLPLIERSRRWKQAAEYGMIDSTER